MTSHNNDSPQAPMTRPQQPHPPQPKEYIDICPHKIEMTAGGDCNYTHSDCQYQLLEWDGEMLQKMLCGAPRPHPAQARSGCNGCRKETEHLECPTPGHCDQMKCPICCEGSDFPTLPEEIKKYEAAAARAAREDVQPFIDLVRLIETKNREMADLMRRNGMKIDNLNDPMQKLAFTFYSEIGEMAHKAGVLLVEHEAALLRGEQHE